jgi:hypothetical protein
MLPGLTAIALLPFLHALQEGPQVTRIQGDSVHYAGGTIRAWVEVDVAGVPVALGVSLPDSVIARVGDEGVMLSLDFPAVRGLPFKHVLFDWVPHGHPPADLYAHPHWDAHFYLITAAEREAIEGGETTARPDARFMPDGFVPVPQLGLYAFPAMGVHWVHEAADELHGHTFDQTIIYGSYGEETIFVEPMFTSAFLAGRPDFSAEIPQPAAVARDGYYPGRYVIRHDAAERGFRISLEAFRWRDAR